MDKSTDLPLTRRANSPAVSESRRLGDLSPNQIRDLRRQRLISEADVDRWTDLAAGAILRVTDGRHL